MAYTALTKDTLTKLRGYNLPQHQIASLNEKAIKEKDERIRKQVVSWHPKNGSNKNNVTVLLLGKTGAGKSATGNLILGERVFAESSQSNACTGTTYIAKRIIDGTEVTVIDTPGFCDTGRSAEDIRADIQRAMRLVQGNIDGFLYVRSLGNPRFTTEEKSVFQQIRQMSTAQTDIIGNCFVVLTRCDKLVQHQSLSAYMEHERNSDFGELMNNTVNKRVIAVENGEETIYGRKIQREQIVRMVAANQAKKSSSQEDMAVQSCVFAFEQMTIVSQGTVIHREQSFTMRSSGSHMESTLNMVQHRPESMLRMLLDDFFD